AHVKRPGEQQDQPGEDVTQRLLCGDPDQDRGKRAADDELPDRDLEQREPDDERENGAGKDDRVADHGRMSGAGHRLKGLARPARARLAMIATRQNKIAATAATSLLPTWPCPVQ